MAFNVTAMVKVATEASAQEFTYTGVTEEQADAYIASFQEAMSQVWLSMPACDAPLEVAAVRMEDVSWIKLLKAEV